MATPYDEAQVVSVNVESVGESKPGKHGKTSYVVKALVPGVGNFPATLLVEKSAAPAGIKPGEHWVKLGVDKLKEGKDPGAPWNYWYKVIAWDVSEPGDVQLDGDQAAPYGPEDAGEPPDVPSERRRDVFRPLRYDEGKAVERRSIERQKGLDLAIRCLETGVDAMKALLLAELFSRHIAGGLADQDISDLEERLVSLGLIPPESPAAAPSMAQTAPVAPKATPALSKAVKMAALHDAASQDSPALIPPLSRRDIPHTTMTTREQDAATAKAAKAPVATAKEAPPYPDILRIPARLSELQLKQYMARLNWTEADISELAGETFQSFADSSPGMHPDALRRDYLVDAIEEAQRREPQDAEDAEDLGLAESGTE